MELVGDKTGVIFDHGHKFRVDVGGIMLQKADSWEHVEGTDEQHKQVSNNVNRIEVNPQIAKVLIGSSDSFFKPGDIIFTHYLAFEHKDDIEIDDVVISSIDTEFVIFKIVDGEKVMQDGFYLGEQVMENKLNMQNGLMIDVMERKVSLTIKITDVPNNPTFKVGDVIQSVDDYNYQFEFEGENFVFIKEEEIIAKLT